MRQEAKRRLYLMNRERTRLENIGARTARRIGSRARAHSLAAYRMGHSPVKAAMNVIHGNDALDQSGIIPIITDAMLAAHLVGRRRTELFASQASGRPIRLAYTGYEETLDWLNKRLDTSNAQLKRMEKQYDLEALRVTKLASAKLEKALERSISESITGDLSVSQGVGALKQAYQEAGFAPEADYTLEAVFRTQVQMAYSAGRMNAMKDPAIAEILVSLTYNTVGDDRVRENHAEFDGTTRPPNDPCWEAWTPPCGYNCRCTLLENYDDSYPMTDVPDVEPDEGFSFNPGNLFTEV